MSKSLPDEVINFKNNLSIELCYSNTQTYTKCRNYDMKALLQGFVWHQIIVLHNGKLRGKDDALDAIFDVISDVELFPISYRRGTKEDRFLVRQCTTALEKLFEQNLRIQLFNATYVNLKVQLNVGDFKFGQISPVTKIAELLQRLFDTMECVDGESGILNLSRFRFNNELSEIEVILRNRAVFERVCDLIYRNDEKFRNMNGLILSHNGIVTLAPLQIFAGCNFSILDLRDNFLRSGVRLCRDLKDIKADKLFLAGNPLTKISSYPECITSILKNFKTIDGIPSENLTKEYTPLNNDVDVECDGHRIDWSNKEELDKFRNSDDWHAVIIPDQGPKFSKEEIFDYFFITVSPELDDVYPCYYKYTLGEHQFLVRHCFDQLKHLAVNCNLEIRIPRLIDCATDALVTNMVQCDETLFYYLRMNISPFKHGQVEPMDCIDRALARRFSAMDRMLNLEDFQCIEGLENIIINLSSPKILSRVLIQASRKYLDSCIEVRLCRNKILNINLPKILTMMNNLKAIDLGNNWIHDLEDIKDLQKLDLKSLRLDGNPLCVKFAFAAEYIKAVKSYFPGLHKLDNIEITKRGNLSSQKNFLCDVKGYDFVEQFITSYFKTFESSDRLKLQDLYHPKAIFSMTSNYAVSKLTTHNYKRISKYTDFSRNIFKISDFARAFTTIHFGPHAIAEVFAALPVMAHDFLTFNTDTTVFDDVMVAITVSGVFFDQAPTIVDSDMLMAFSRTFILTPVKHGQGILKRGTSYQIVNEQFNVYNPTPTQTKNAFKYLKTDAADKPDIITLADKEAFIVMFQEITNLKPIWCTRCLEDGKWDFKKSLERFLSLSENKEIPDTAFI